MDLIKLKKDVFFVHKEIIEKYVKSYSNLLNSEMGQGLGFVSELDYQRAYDFMVNNSAVPNYLLLICLKDLVLASGILSLRTSEVQGHVGDIKKVIVNPSYRKKGLGFEILTRLEEKAREESLESLILTVRTNLEGAISLYESFGFKSVGIYQRASKVNHTYFDVLSMQKLL